MSYLRQSIGRLVRTTVHEDALSLVERERDACLLIASANSDAAKAAKSAIVFLDYIRDTWLPIELWKSWSQYGRETAAEKMGIPVEEVLPTTNHLEALNGSLKRKYIPQWQNSGHRLRFDVLIYHMIVSILPRLYARRRMLTGYAD